MNSQEVVIVGLGYIGLPTAALISSNKIPVLGVDINQSVVDTVNAGKIHIVEPALDIVIAKSIENGFLRAATTPEEGNVYIIVVPTPFKTRNEPDISFVVKATKSVIPLLKENDLFVIESTCPIGTTQSMMNYIYSERPELNGKIHIAYCPERVLPGNVMYELVNNDRVIGGVDQQSTEKAIAFYRQFVKGNLHPTNSRTAEMCKLTENSSRDVQIAFANELSLICDKADIDVWELIQLANKHPRVNILQPGCGVGGHCIAVDPYFIVADFPLESQIIGKAREINNYKSFWCVEKVKTEKLNFQIKNGRKAIVALMGLAFKPNIDDLRESPAMFIAKRITQDDHNDSCLIVEPNIYNHEEFKLTSTQDAIEKADILVFLVSHNEFKGVQINKEKIILDFCGVFS